MFSIFQASKKASNKRQRGGQKSCSNVFSMFEQSQIQEFKEVRCCAVSCPDAAPLPDVVIFAKGRTVNVQDSVSFVALTDELSVCSV